MRAVDLERRSLQSFTSCPGEGPGIQGQAARSKRPLDRRVKPGDDVFFVVKSADA
jgi:hypothetical protein